MFHSPARCSLLTIVAGRAVGFLGGLALARLGVAGLGAALLHRACLRGANALARRAHGSPYALVTVGVAGLALVLRDARDALPVYGVARARLATAGPGSALLGRAHALAEVIAPAGQAVG